MPLGLSRITIASPAVNDGCGGGCGACFRLGGPLFDGGRLRLRKSDRHRVVRLRQFHFQRRGERFHARLHLAGSIQHQIAGGWLTRWMPRQRNQLNQHVSLAAGTIHQRETIAVEPVGKRPQVESLAPLDPPLGRPTQLVDHEVDDIGGGQPQGNAAARRCLAYANVYHKRRFTASESFCRHRTFQMGGILIERTVRPRARRQICLSPGVATASSLGS